MKIVQLNKFFFPEYGTERYMFGLMDELTRRGHELIPFAMHHQKNVSTPYAKYFVSNIDAQTTTLSLRSLKAFARAVYSREARKKFARLLDDTRPDVVHVHTIHHHLSPSILREARKRKIPIVQTLHDYKLVNPAYLFPLRDGRPCTECRRGNWLHLIRHRAHKNSRLSTAALVLESFIHATTRIYERSVYRFIAPSRDMAGRLIEFGVAPGRVSVIPHFIDLESWRPAQTRGVGVLFAGRLMADRGLDHVVHIAQALPGTQIKVAGDGPERASLEARLTMLGIKNVTMLGRLSGDDLIQAYKNARIVLFPSLTLDTFGLSVLEAMASNKPVVATRLGGVLDLISDNENGILYQPDQPEQAVAGIKKLLGDDVLARTLGRNARKTAEEFSLTDHYERIINMYATATINSVEQRLERLYASKLGEATV